LRELLVAITKLVVAALADGVVGLRSRAAMVVLSMLLSVALLCVTIRRLRDAGISPWWVLLFVCPIGFDWDLLHINLHVPAMYKLPGSYLSFDFVDFRSLIVFMPIMLGLFKRAAPIDRQLI
jgi:uncharacterized membrane protein YhaH (DUF805 family)